MTSENQDEPLMLNDQPMNAWAAALGIDMSLIKLSVSHNLTERFREHNRALRLGWELREVMKRGNARLNFEANTGQAGC